MTSACLGGTVLRSLALREGTLRLYRSCGGYYAQFGSNGVRRTFRLEVLNWNSTGYKSVKQFYNSYGGWTDLIPGSCVAASVTFGSSLPKTVTYGCPF